MKGFVDFIREQKVVSLAVGFILGGAVSKLVASLVKDIITPVISIVLGATEELQTASFKLGTANIMWGSFVSSLVDFLVIALVVYYGVKGVGLDKLDKKKK